MFQHRVLTLPAFALALLSGNVGRSGGGVYFHLHSYRNLDLAWVKGPGHKGRRAFHIATVGRDILAAQDPPVRMIWVNGINVVNQAPGAGETARAFDGVEFKVVVDAFMTDTAQRADLVLPCTLMLEQQDIVGSFLHEYVQYAAAVVDPGAELGTGVTIGPYAVIGPQVEIRAGTTVGPHAVIEGRTRIGERNRVFQFASVCSAVAMVIALRMAQASARSRT